MAVSYAKLWKVLINKKMSKVNLRCAACIAPNTMTKLRRDEDVSMEVLGRICQTLNKDFGDIMECVSKERGSLNYDTRGESKRKDRY